MKNLFSNILNKKQKEIIEEEKEELNINPQSMLCFISINMKINET